MKVDKINADFLKCSAVSVLVGLSPNEKRQNRMIEKVDHGTEAIIGDGSNNKEAF